MPGLHAVLSASGASRWLACPPSARLEEKLKERFGEGGSVFADEGTQAHALAELKLRHENGEYNDFLYKQMHDELAAKITAKGYDLKAMERFTNDYVDVVMERLFSARKVCPDAKLIVEQHLDFSPWVPHGFGTGDACIVSDAILDVIDLKYGQGIPVSAENNPQPRLYGLGAVNEFGVLYSFPTVRTTIVQPRLSSVSTETLTRAELLEWGESIKPKADMAWRGEGEYATGDHCRFCAAKAICAKRASEALSTVQHGFATPDVIRDEDIPGILAVLDVAEAWFKDIKAYALSQALRGQQWRGYKLVRGRRGKRTFTDTEKVREQLARAGYSSEQIEKRELLGVSDIEKLIGKQAFDVLLSDLTTQAPGALVLAPEDDARPAYSSAEADFGDLI